MPKSARRRAPWLRLAVSVAGVISLICLQSVAPAAARIAGPAGTAASTGGSGVTVSGPRMWDPKTRSDYTVASSFTVSQTSNLVNQFVSVSWTSLTPSRSSDGMGGGYNFLYTLYPVQVAECAGTDPQSITAKCDGLDDYLQVPGDAGPTTEVDGLTGPAVSATQSPTQGGAGHINIQVLTAQQDYYLGCGPASPCSLVILPVDGGDATPGHVNCANHSHDFPVGADMENAIENPACAWANHVTIPLYFAPGQADCKFTSPDFTVIGSPMMQRAMTSWISKLCVGRQPVHFSFAGTIGEPLARVEFLSGVDDVALTTDPAIGPAARRSYTYAPVAITAESVAYWLDNPRTGAPYTQLDLTPRLVTKLITGSYDWAMYGCDRHDVKHPPPYPCNPAIYGNPASMLSDPDFVQYNGHLGANGQLAGIDFPTVLSGDSDMTWELTRWIAANPAAVTFLHGWPDPWGMRVNVNYLNLRLPEQAFTVQDPYPVWQDEFSPQFPLTRVAEEQADNTSPGANPADEQCNPGGTCVPQPNGNEQPGTRDLMAIVDEPDAVADDFPTAALQNHAGDFVTASPATMTAAVDTMITNRDGITQDDNENTTNPDAYPLTMVVYAMVPTSHTPKAEAAKIAQWLDYVAGAGQVQGTGAGQLPAGYLPLTARMRAQTLQAAYDVLHQNGATPPGGYDSPRHG
jgi:hypothetical protein